MLLRCLAWLHSGWEESWPFAGIFRIQGTELFSLVSTKFFLDCTLLRAYSRLVCALLWVPLIFVPQKLFKVTCLLMPPLLFSLPFFVILSLLFNWTIRWKKRVHVISMPSLTECPHYGYEGAFHCYFYSS